MPPSQNSKGCKFLNKTEETVAEARLAPLISRASVVHGARSRSLTPQKARGFGMTDARWCTEREAGPFRQVRNLRSPPQKARGLGKTDARWRTRSRGCQQSQMGSIEVEEAIGGSERHPDAHCPFRRRPGLHSPGRSRPEIDSRWAEDSRASHRCPKRAGR
jgi:hypothetical protein